MGSHSSYRNMGKEKCWKAPVCLEKSSNYERYDPQRQHSQAHYTQDHSASSTFCFFAVEVSSSSSGVLEDAAAATLASSSAAAPSVR